MVIKKLNLNFFSPKILIIIVIEWFLYWAHKFDESLSSMLTVMLIVYSSEIQSRI